MQLFRNRYLKLAVEFLSIAFAGVVILSLLLIWRLSSGPINVGFLSYKIEKILGDKGRDIETNIGSTVLSWNKDDQSLLIEAKDVNFYSIPNNQVSFLNLERVGLNFDISDLIIGTLRPTKVIIFKPTMELVRDQNNKLTFALGTADPNTKQAENSRPIEQLKRTLDINGPLSKLKEFMIYDATVKIDDMVMERTWILPNIDIDFGVEDARLVGQAKFQADITNKPTDFDADIILDLIDESGQISFSFSELSLASIAELSPRFQKIAGFDLPLSGSVTMRVRDRKLDGKVNFDVYSQGGMMQLPINDLKPLKLTGGEFNGYYDLNSRTFAIDKLSTSIPNIDSDKAAALNGQVVAVLDEDKEKFGTKIKLSLVLEGLTAPSLAVYWPTTAASDARDWITTNIPKANISKATLDLEGYAHKDEILEFDASKVSGMIELQNAEVHYRAPMPPATDVKAISTYDQNGFDITIEAGQVDNIKLKHGQVQIKGLKDTDQILSLDLDIESPIADALNLINSEPLKLIDKSSVKGKKINGHAETNLKMSFPLLKELAFENIDLLSTAKLTKVEIPNVYDEIDLLDGYLDLKADQKSLDLTGVGEVGLSQKSINYHENFSSAADLNQTISLKGFFSVPDIEKLGIPSFKGLTGGVDADLTYQEYNKKKASGATSSLIADVDLMKANLNISALGYTKAADVPGTAKAIIDLQHKTPLAIRDFKINATGLSANGTIGFNSAGALKNIHVKQLKLPGTDLMLNAEDLRKDKNGKDPGWQAELRGSSLNLKPILKAKSDDDDEKMITRPVNMKLALSNVYIAKDSPLKNLKGQMLHNGNVWNHAQITGEANPGLLDIKIIPSGGGRIFTILSDNAGSFLRAADLFETVRGGTISVSGKIDDQKQDHPMDIDVKMTKFKVVNAPVLTKILSLASLTGILDLLSGQGLVFDKLTGKITENKNVLLVDKVEAYGSSLGMNVDGTINLDTDQMDLDGTIIPANALNTGLSSIPVLGAILTGKDREGIFAGKFSIEGDMDNPDVSVNPLSSIAPGILRDFFDAISGGGSSSDLKKD